MPRLWLADTAHETICREAKTRRLVETGGPLFGYTDGATRDSVVAIAYGPGPDARHRPRSLRPDREATERAIHEVHAQTGGVLKYVGEWHTHVGGCDRPSRRDINSLVAIASEAGVDLAEPIALIIPTVILRRRVRLREPGAYRWSPRIEAVERLELSATGDVWPGLVNERRRDG